MAVEDVFKPSTVKQIDPRNVAEKKEGDKGYWQQKAEEAKARHDYLEYEHAIKMMEGQPPESPLKITGEVSLGKVDFQEQQRKAQEAADKARQETATALQKERERATNAEQELYKERIENLRHDFENQMRELNKTIERLLTANKRDERPIHEQFKEQYTVLQELAKALGYEKTSTGQDPMVAIELKKMEFQEARADREFKWKMRQDDKQWEIEKQKMQDDRKFKEAELEQKARRDELLFTAPQTIGAAIAKGLLEHEGGATAPGRVAQSQQGGPKQYRIELDESESGEIECPNCHTPVGIGPTSTAAQCVTCNTKFAVVRTPAGTSTIEGVNEPTAPGEEEK